MPVLYRIQQKDCGLLAFAGRDSISVDCGKPCGDWFLFWICVGGRTGGQLPLGWNRLSLQLLLLVMQLVVAWNYFKLLYVVAERYVLLGIFSYTAPLAFATGGAKRIIRFLRTGRRHLAGRLF